MASIPNLRRKINLLGVEVANDAGDQPIAAFWNPPQSDRAAISMDLDFEATTNMAPTNFAICYLWVYELLCVGTSAADPPQTIAEVKAVMDDQIVKVEETVPTAEWTAAEAPTIGTADNSMIWRPDLLSWQTLSGIKGPEPLYFRDHWLSWGRGNAFRTGEDQHMRLTFMEKRTISRGISGFQWPTITVIGFTPVPQLTQEDWDDCMPPATWEQLDFLQNITDPLTGIVGGFKKTAGVNEYREWALVNYHTADDRLVEVDWEINGKIEALYRRYDASPQEISPNPKP